MCVVHELSTLLKYINARSYVYNVYVIISIQYISIECEKCFLIIIVRLQNFNCGTFFPLNSKLLLKLHVHVGWDVLCVCL